MIVVTDMAQCTILILKLSGLVTSTKTINKGMERLSFLMDSTGRENLKQVGLAEKL